MKIGWIASTTGCFGAVREMLELSNALVRLGHQVTVYDALGAPIKWLPYLGSVGTFADAEQVEHDVLILLCEWRMNVIAPFLAATARLKAVTVMGFDPSLEMAEILRGEVLTVAPDLQIFRDMLHLPGAMVLCDGSWQCRWLRENVPGLLMGPPIGGVNLEQFYHVKQERKRPPWRILATGDPRERKGSTIVRQAVGILESMGMPLEFETYWGKRMPQKDMAAWYSGGDVFLDAERRAGWCNPVAEAMACGTACVTTQIGGVEDFALNGQTALLVPVDNAQAMAGAVMQLLGDGELRQRLIHAAFKRIRRYSYDLVAAPVMRAFEERLS